MWVCGGCSGGGLGWRRRSLSQRGTNKTVTPWTALSAKNKNRATHVARSCFRAIPRWLRRNMCRHQPLAQQVARALSRQPSRSCAAAPHHRYSHHATAVQPLRNANTATPNSTTMLAHVRVHTRDCHSRQRQHQPNRRDDKGKARRGCLRALRDAANVVTARRAGP